MPQPIPPQPEATTYIGVYISLYLDTNLGHIPSVAVSQYNGAYIHTNEWNRFDIFLIFSPCR